MVEVYIYQCLYVWLLLFFCLGNDMECDHHFQISARRHGMEVIVRALYSYISLHTVQSQWGAFAKQIGGSLAAEAGELMLEELTKAKSLDEVCEKHEACVDSILHRYFLLK